MKMEETTNTTTTLTTIESDNGGMLLAGGSGRNSFSSLSPKTFEEKKAFYNAINNPDKRLGEMINLEIELKHVYAEECVYISKDTGEAQNGVRIILIDKEGVSYNTSSIGVYNCLSKMFTILGTPNTWKSPVKVRVNQVSHSTERKVLTLVMV